jgi:lysophospholipase L1-like esterase
MCLDSRPTQETEPRIDALILSFLAAFTLAPIRVACVGDSITQGRGGENSYPAQLQQILGRRYKVENFGRVSAGVLPGTLQYSKLPECQAAMDFHPDVVIIMLGTNDSPGPNWAERREVFQTSFRSLTNGFQALPSRPKVIVALPPPMFFGEADWRPKNLVEEIIPVERSVADLDKLPIFDAFSLFGGKSETFPDRLHPSNLGFRILAHAMASEIFGKKSRPMKSIDWADQTKRQVIVDREEGQYLGHVSSTLLSDGKTILIAYPKGHGKGQIVLKRSEDGGRTWSSRLPVPDNWSTSLETPTLHRVKDRTLILWSGLYPARIARSEDDGATWTPLTQVGDWAGIVVMGFTENCRDGRMIAQFHDDGRFFTKDGKASGIFRLFQTESTDEGKTWTSPIEIYHSAEVNLCEPGNIRSDDGRQIAVLLRENKRVKPSHVIFSNDEGKHWSEPRPLNPALTGDRHTLRRLPDGRIVCVFRDMAEGPWKGDFVAWVGHYEDLVMGGAGEMRIRLLDNQNSWDCGYPGLELMPDGTLVAITYGKWIADQPNFIKAVRIPIRNLK